MEKFLEIVGVLEGRASVEVIIFVQIISSINISKGFTDCMDVVKRPVG